jgi:hypothetical protein
MMQPGLDLPSLADVIGRPEWMDRGACREESTAKFFPAVGGSAKVMAEARALCASCPVRPECLSYALAVLSGPSPCPTHWPTVSSLGFGPARRFTNVGRCAELRPMRLRNGGVATTDRALAVH